MEITLENLNTDEISAIQEALMRYDPYEDDGYSLDEQNKLYIASKRILNEIERKVKQIKEVHS